MKNSSGVFVSPQVDTNFNCLQTSGDFCAPTTPTTQQLNNELTNVTNLLNAVQSQSANLSSTLQQQVQPLITQLQNLQTTLQQ